MSNPSQITSNGIMNTNPIPLLQGKVDSSSARFAASRRLAGANASAPSLFNRGRQSGEISVFSTESDELVPVGGMSKSLELLRVRLEREKNKLERARSNPDSIELAPIPGDSTPPLPRSLSAVAGSSSYEANASELMKRGRLALEFKMDTSKETVVRVGSAFEQASVSAAWFECAPPSVPQHDSFEHLTNIRALAATKSLSWAVTGGVQSTARPSPQSQSHSLSPHQHATPARSISPPFATLLRASPTAITPSLPTKTEVVAVPPASSSNLSSSSSKPELSNHKTIVNKSESPRLHDSGSEDNWDDM